MTDTKGNGILNSLFDGYEPYKGDIVTRSQGSLVAFESGEAVAYGLFNARNVVTCSSAQVQKYMKVW